MTDVYVDYGGLGYDIVRVLFLVCIIFRLGLGQCV